jgi:hypothetical protein
MLAGASGGLVYYLKVGCHNGSCPIWSSPWLSILWGAVAGYLIGDLFTRKKAKEYERPTGGKED